MADLDNDVGERLAHRDAPIEEGKWQMVCSTSQDVTLSAIRVGEYKRHEDGMRYEIMGISLVRRKALTKSGFWGLTRNDLIALRDTITSLLEDTHPAQAEIASGYLEAEVVVGEGEGPGTWYTTTVHVPAALSDEDAQTTAEAMVLDQLERARKVVSFVHMVNLGDEILEEQGGDDSDVRDATDGPG